MFENFSKTETARKTFFFDNLRCFFAGIVEAGFKNFALVIAIRVFSAPKSVKSTIASALAIGFFITPISQALASQTKKMTTMCISSVYMVLVAIFVMLATFSTNYQSYGILMLCAMLIFRQPIPLIEDVYGQNYSINERGSRISFALMILPISTLVMSPIIAKIMDIDLQNYRAVLLIISLSAIGEAVALSKIPARVLPHQDMRSIFLNFKEICGDKLFMAMLAWWTLSGFANRMIVPLKTEYLINSEYGVNATIPFEALACVTIPYGVRFLSSLQWGRIFDKANVITVLVALNCILMASFLLFFHSKSHEMICLAAVLNGIAYGGKEVLWCLWITKIVPKDKFSAYMSINIAASGLRGMIAPNIAYQLLQHYSIQQISIQASVLVMISTIGFLMLYKNKRLHTASQN